MCKKCQKSTSLDTLAQLHTEVKIPIEKEDFVPLKNCTKSEDKKILQNRAKRKYLSTALSLGLIEYCDINPKKSELKKSYWNTFHCANILAEKEGKITTNYCKNRWCLQCNAIRQMVLKKKYGEILESWENKHFVTLTIPNCKEEDLGETITQMKKVFTQIKNMLYQRWRRGKGSKFIGLRKMECTYNPFRDDYHPHFHLVVSNGELAKELMEEWLLRNPTCDRKAQDVRKADENSTKELFKYFTKVITTQDKEKKIYIHALNTIFETIRGQRTFQPFGFKAAKITDEEILEEEEIVTDENAENEELPRLYRWVQKVADWVNKDDGEMLSGYLLSESLQEIANNRILLDSS